MSTSHIPIRFRSFIAAMAIGTISLTAAGCSSSNDAASATPTAAVVLSQPAQPSQPASQASQPAQPPEQIQERPVTAASPIRTIVVHGVGRASAAPDQATITMGVETVGDTAQAALRENTAKATEVIKLLKAAGVEDKFIQTSQLSIYPRYDNEGRKITGYQVSNIVTATLKDLKKAGEIIDQAAGIAGDAIRIQGLSFSLSEESELMASTQKNARTRAVGDARLQAEQLAEAAGVKLGQLRTISTSSSMSAPILYQQNLAKTSADPSGTVPLEGGSQTVTADVDLVFDIS